MATYAYVIDPRTGRRVLVQRTSKKPAVRKPAVSVIKRPAVAVQKTPAGKKPFGQIVRGFTPAGTKGAAGQVVRVKGKDGKTALVRLPGTKTPKGAPATPAKPVKPARITPSKPIRPSTPKPADADTSNWDKLFAMMGGGTPAQTGAGSGGGGGGPSGSGESGGGGESPATPKGEQGYPEGEDYAEPSDELDIFAKGGGDEPADAPADKKKSEVDIETEPEVDIEAEPEGEPEGEAEAEPPAYDVPPGMGMDYAPVLVRRPAPRVPALAPAPQVPVAAPPVSRGAKIARAGACVVLGFLLGAVLFGED